MTSRLGLALLALCVLCLVNAMDSRNFRAKKWYSWNNELDNIAVAKKWYDWQNVPNALNQKAQRRVDFRGGKALQLGPPPTSIAF
ncbi:unnamed protein product [Caenorhabditis auriculariae]|uniref:Uncharacterized protein n=1 Tax=Caenorhabditis auriculariae TaxID=2777116 RepID=A0A8S1HG38_9PELO|nr:unnamed protein product [Caenorhabditis auriculariae]